MRAALLAVLIQLTECQLLAGSFALKRKPEPTCTYDAPCETESVASDVLLQSSSVLHPAAQPAALSEDDPDRDVKIAFSGRYGGNWWENYTLPNGEKVVRGRIYRRPEWTKHYRCSGDSQETCEGCAGDENCWHMFPPVPWKLVVEPSMANGGDKWKRYGMIMHVHCEHAYLGLSATTTDLKSGTLHFLFDGVEITGDKFDLRDSSGVPHPDGTPTEFNSPVKDTPESRWWARLATGIDDFRTQIPLTGHGGHEFVIEYRRLDTPNDWAVEKNFQAGVGQPTFFMPESFRQCEDTKACLNAFPNVADGMELRNSNFEQLQCLNHDLSSLGENSPCRVWRECLLNAGWGHSQERMIHNILEAAGVRSSGAHLLQLEVERDATQTHGWRAGLGNKVGKKVDQGSDSECLSPPLEDPESWHCDCFQHAGPICESFKNQVDGSTDSDCYRAMICNNPRVCKWWKDQHCGNVNVAALGSVIDGLQLVDTGVVNAGAGADDRQPSTRRSDRSVLQQRARADEEDTQEFEETLRSKACV